MSSREDKKSKRRRRDDDDDNAGFVRGSGVNYSKVSDRHVDDNRYEKLKQAPSAGEAPTPNNGSAAPTPASSAAQPPKISSQMAAVMRIMAGKEERTIAEKLADSNRPTWEQYKKDNEDKLQIEGLDQKKMEAYRKELDEQREKLLTRGLNHQKEKDDKKSKKKKKRKHRSKRHDDSYSNDSESTDDYSSDSSRKHKRKKHRRKSDRKHKKSSRRYDSDSYDSEDDRRKSSKHKRKKDKKRKKSDDGSSSGDSYRLSSFFTKGSDNEKT